MKIGKYEKQMSLLWDNNNDNDLTEALRELRFKQNNLTRLVIKIDGTMSYSTKQLIQWFMNQRFSCGEQYTHKLNEQGRMVLLTRKVPYKFRHYIPGATILWDGTKIHLHPGEHAQNYKMGYSTTKARYYALMDDTKWEAPIKRSIKTEKPEEEQAILNILKYVYETDDDDSAQYFFEQKMMISKLPYDEVIYGWLCDNGVAPRTSSLVDPSLNPPIIDEEAQVLIGKTAIMDAEEYEQNPEELYYAY